MAINFYSEKIVFVLKNKSRIRKLLKIIAEEEAKNISDVNYIFCSDAYLYKLNKKWLGHNTYTDVISFPLSDNPEIIAGEIYISINRIRDNAKKFNSSFDDELLRVIVHGMLHLCAYEDITKQQKSRMTALENKYLIAF